MSILVNSRGTNEYTIVRFGQFFDSSYYAREYVSVNNKYFTVPTTSDLKWRYTYGSGECDMVMIRADIKEDAEGYIYGFKTATAEMSIQKYTTQGGEKKIKWTIGSRSGERNWEAGVHIYGFLSNGFGYYDGIKVGNNGSASVSLIASGASGSLNERIIIGGLVDATGTTVRDCIHMTGSSYCIDIYEAVISAYNETNTKRTMAHMYAASNGLTATASYMYEPLYYRGQVSPSTGKAQTGVTASDATPSSTITYGVQLHDLKFITSSGYRDLMAIVCNDDDVPGHASPNAETAYTLSGPDSQTYISAFMLKGSDINGGGTITMPIPAGWSHESQQTRPKTDGRLGALISGRIPKWFLWSDNINVGKFAMDDGSKWEFLYNITNPRGGEGKLDLKFFEGLTNAATGHHDPVFDMGGSITIEYHNGLAFQCNDTTRIALFSNDSNYAVSPNDDMRVFKGVLSTMSNPTHMALGNMVDWHKTAAEQKSDSDTVSEHTKKWYMFFGISGTIQRNYGNGQTRKVAAAWEQTASSGSSVSLPLLPLSSGTTSAEKEKFRDGKSNGAWYAWGGENGFSVCGSERDQDLIFYEILANSGNPIEGEGKLDLIINSQAIQTQDIPESSLCDTTAVIPATKVDIAGNMNPKTSGNDQGSTNYRCILMNETAKIGNTTVYIYPLYAGQDKVRQAAYGCATRVQDTVANNPVFQLIICCLNGQITDSNASAVNLSNGMHLTAEFTTISGSNITRTLIDKDFILGPNDVVNAPLKLHRKNTNGGVQTIDDNNEATCTASLNIKKNDIAAHCTNYSEGWRLTTDTTVRVWVEPSTDIKPKIKLLGFTYYLNEGAYKSDSPFYGDHRYTLIQKSDLFRMTSQNDAINMLLECWDNTSTTPGEYVSFDIDQLTSASDTGTSKYGIAIKIYKTWNTPSGNDNPFCGFIIFRAASSDTSAQSGLKAYGLYGNAWETPYSPTSSEHHQYHLDVYGGTINPRVVIQDTVSSGSYTKWGSNNLLVSVTRAKGSDFYQQ